MPFEHRLQQESITTLGELSQLRQLIDQNIGDSYKHLNRALTITVHHVADMYSNNHGECENLDLVLADLHGIKADLGNALLLEAALLSTPGDASDSGAVMHRAYLGIIDKLHDTVSGLSIITYYWTAGASAYE